MAKGPSKSTLTTRFYAAWTYFGRLRQLSRLPD
jgi:hypothetical protein